MKVFTMDEHGTKRIRSRDEICTEFGKNIVGAIVTITALGLAINAYINSGDILITTGEIPWLMAVCIVLVLAPYEVGWFTHNWKKYSSKEVEAIDCAQYWIAGIVYIGILFGIAGIFFVLAVLLPAYLGLLPLPYEQKYGLAELALYLYGMATFAVIVLRAAYEAIKRIIPWFKPTCKIIGCLLLRTK